MSKFRIVKRIGIGKDRDYYDIEKKVLGFWFLWQRDFQNQDAAEEYLMWRRGKKKKVVKEIEI